mmetsp:Transcript_34756/g.70974  ORF Transcript_34756/g.70974 Transcript_34756/m.70974 type:complete len:133 (+) Transcript_34756:35-433(+)
MKFSLFTLGAALFACGAEAFVPATRSFARVPALQDVKIVSGEGEPLESLLRRFKREVNNAGALMELRHRRYFENSQDLKKRKIKEQRRRIKNERMAARKNNKFNPNSRPTPKGDRPPPGGAAPAPAPAPASL